MPIKKDRVMDLPKMTGSFSLEKTTVLTGYAFTGTLKDGAEICIIGKDFEAIGAALDALQWDGEVDVEKFQEIVIAPRAALKCTDDDIPF